MIYRPEQIPGAVPERWDFDRAGVLARHPLSAVWGDANAADAKSIEEMVVEFGVREPILVCDGKVVDGWQRLTAFKTAFVEMRVSAEMTIPVLQVGPVPTTGEVDWAEWRALLVARHSRRNMAPIARAKAVVKTQEWLRGRPRRVITTPVTSSSPAIRVNELERVGQLSYFSPASEDEMAKEAGVSTRTIRRAKVAVRSEERGQSIAEVERRKALNRRKFQERKKAARSPVPAPAAGSERRLSAVEAVRLPTAPKPPSKKDERIAELEARVALLENERTTDKALIRQAEAERRKHEGADGGAADRFREVNRAHAERAEALSEAATLRSQLRVMRVERDRWKRRCLAAEAHGSGNGD